MVGISVVDPDPDRVGSESFCRIRIGISIQGMPIRIWPIWIDTVPVPVPINFMHTYFLQKKFNMRFRILLIMTHLPMMRKVKKIVNWHCREKKY
jgi:hypothetical protein